MKDGASWYPRNPQKYLGGVVGLTARQHCVYAIILDLLYAHGGEIVNNPTWIAGWISDMGAAAVRNTIAELVALEKLIENGGKITEKHAKNAAKTKEELSANGKKLAEKRWKSDMQNEEKQELSDAACIHKTHAYKIREDKIREEEEERKEDPRARARSKPIRSDAVRQALGKVLDAERVEAVIEHRRALRKPMTLRAAELLAAQFSRARDGPNAAADAMIENGWVGFSQDWVDNRNGRNINGSNGKTGTVAAFRALRDRVENSAAGGREPLSDYGGPGGREGGGVGASIFAAPSGGRGTR